ncbi:MAG: hypothetical protein HYY23_12805 [Verrucomicrobia bacterium]|nr:hypothetical protein [Verrucomicrobiota bacterium]
MKPYPLQLEISGPIALWARPDTMPNPVSYVDAFQRRLERGRWFYTPCLHSTVPLAHRMGEGSGVRATLDYVGPFRDGTAPCATENHVIPAFLEMVFNQPPIRLSN